MTTTFSPTKLIRQLVTSAPIKALLREAKAKPLPKVEFDGQFYEGFHVIEAPHLGLTLEINVKDDERGPAQWLQGLTFHGPTGKKPGYTGALPKGLLFSDDKKAARAKLPHFHAMTKRMNGADNIDVFVVNKITCSIHYAKDGKSIRSLECGL